MFSTFLRAAFPKNTICHFENDVETKDVLFCFMFQFYIFLEGQQF